MQPGISSGDALALIEKRSQGIFPWKNLPILSHSAGRRNGRSASKLSISANNASARRAATPSIVEDLALKQGQTTFFYGKTGICPRFHCGKMGSVPHLLQCFEARQNILELVELVLHGGRHHQEVHLGSLYEDIHHAKDILAILLHHV